MPLFGVPLRFPSKVRFFSYTAAMTWKRSAVAAVAVVALVAGATVSYAVARDDNEASPEPTALGPAEWPERAEPSGEYPRPDLISEPQWAMVRDGRVTDEEMRQAAEATVACAAEAGVTLTVYPGADGDARGTLTHMSASGEPSWAVRDCKWKFMDAVSLLYGSQIDARAYATTEEHVARWDGCLATQGFPGQWPGILGRRLSDPKAPAAIDACRPTADTIPLTVSLEGDASFATIESCLAAHGYVFPPRAEPTEPFWTPERLNTIDEAPGLAPIWRTCHLVGQVKSRVGGLPVPDKTP